MAAVRCPRSPARSGPTQEVCGCAGRRPRVACGLRFGDTWAMVVTRRHHRSQLLHPQASRSPSAPPTRRSPRRPQGTTTSRSTAPPPAPAAAPAPTPAAAASLETNVEVVGAAPSLETNAAARPAPAPMLSLGLYEVLVLAMLLAAVCYVLTVYVLTVARRCSLVLLS